MAVTIKLRRGVLADWERVNPILAEGEPAWAIDAFILKVGNGSLRWSELPAINVPDIDPAEIDRAVNEYLTNNPITITTDATLSVAGAPADAAAVREKCLLDTDLIIFCAGDADDNIFT
jgi:hypothetical protein